eukprot:m.13443 g.13443  ORF g.13443 m.13443 type:complete len:73 (+) comp4152_c0_seq3:1172-1390(+)
MNECVNECEKEEWNGMEWVKTKDKIKSHTCELQQCRTYFAGLWGTSHYYFCNERYPIHQTELKNNKKPCAWK